MTNRERLSRMCLYDLLVEMNSAIVGSHVECVLETLDPEHERGIYCIGVCGECIGRWLNEDARHE